MEKDSVSYTLPFLVSHQKQKAKLMPFKSAVFLVLNYLVQSTTTHWASSLASSTVALFVLQLPQSQLNSCQSAKCSNSSMAHFIHEITLSAHNANSRFNYRSFPPPPTFLSTPSNSHKILGFSPPARISARFSVRVFNTQAPMR